MITKILDKPIFFDISKVEQIELNKTQDSAEILFYFSNRILTFYLSPSEYKKADKIFDTYIKVWEESKEKK